MMLISKAVFKIIFSTLCLTLPLSVSVIANSPTSFSTSIDKPSNQEDIASQLWQRGQIREAIALWEREERIYSKRESIAKQIETVLKIARGYTALGQFELASFKLEKILPLAKDKPVLSARILEQLGNVASRSGELDSAIANYQKSLDLEPSLSTYNNLAISLEKQVIRSRLKARSAREGEETEKYLAEVESYRSSTVEYLKPALAIAEREECLTVWLCLGDWLLYLALVSKIKLYFLGIGAFSDRKKEEI